MTPTRDDHSNRRADTEDNLRLRDLFGSVPLLISNESLADRRLRQRVFMAIVPSAAIPILIAYAISALLNAGDRSWVGACIWHAPPYSCWQP